MMLDEIHYADLIGAPFAYGGTDPRTGIDCWEIVRLVCARRGIPVEPRFSRSDRLAPSGWTRVEEPEPGDVIAYGLESPGIDHVGLVTTDGMILHGMPSRGAVVLDRRMFRDKERGIYRPHTATCIVHILTDIFDPAAVHTSERRCQPLRAYIPPGVHPDRCTLHVDGQPAAWGDTPRPGASIDIAVWPAGPGIATVGFLGATVISGVSAITATILAFVGNLLISFGIGFLLQTLTAPAQRTTDSGEVDPSPTFRLDGIVNTTGSGGTIPIVFGTHRIGGHVLSAFNSISGLTIGYLPSVNPGTLIPPGSPAGTQPPPPFNPNVGPNSIQQNTNVASATGGKTTLNLLIAVSEGPIQSINATTSDANNIAGSAIAAGTMLINGNDASAFAGLTCHVRLGTADQYPIPGFLDTTVGVPQEYVLRYQQPFTYTTSTDVQAFALQLFEPNGHYRTSNAGSNLIKRKFVTYQFKYRPVGATIWTENILIERTYLYRAAHSWEIRRDNLPLGKYEISIERTVPDDDDASFINNSDLSEVSQCNVNAVNEITYQMSNHPGIAILAVQILASDQINGPPTITSLVEGVKCWHSEDGSTWTEEWSDNPADVLQEVLLNKTWGLGQIHSPSDLNFPSLSDFRDECDDTIDDGRGGTITKYRFDYVYDRATKAADLIDRIMTAGRAQLAPLNGKIGVRLETATSPTHMFTEGSIRDLTVTYLDSTARPTRVAVQFANAELDYDIDTVSVEDDTTDTTLFNQETIQAYGVTHPSRAMRMARYRLNVVEEIGKVVRFAADVGSILVQPGDVFYLAHQQLDSAHISGRVLADVSMANEIVLDRGEAVTAGWKIRVMTAGTGSIVLQERTVDHTSSIGGYTVVYTTVDFDSGDLPLHGDAYAIGPSSSYLQAYRCTALTMQPDLSRLVEAVEYSATVYDDDPGDVPESTPLLINRKDIPEPVTGLSVSEENRLMPSGDIRNVLVAAWVAGNVYESADVFTRDPDDDYSIGWEYVGRFNGGRAELGAFGAGETVQIAVASVSPDGNRRDPEQAPWVYHRVRGKLYPPADVTGFGVSENGSDLVFRWTPVSDLDVKGYTIRVGPTWVGSTLVGKAGAHACELRVPVVCPRGTALTYHIKAENTSGRVSQTSATASYDWTGDGYIETDSASEETSWGGTKTDMTVSSGDLVSDSSVTTFSYTTAELSVAGQKRHGIPTAYVAVTVNDRDPLTWADATFSWSSAAARVRTWGGADFSDFPDSYEDAVRTKWKDASFTWGSVYGAGRTWGGELIRCCDVTVESKTNAAAAYASASFDRHVASAPKLSSYGFKISGSVPTDAYLITYDSMATALYQRDLSRDGYEFDDDFYGSNTEGGEIGILGWTQSGTSTSIARGTQDESGHPGQYLIGTAATTNSVSSLNTNSNGLRFGVVSGVRQTHEFWFYTPDTTSCAYVIGLTNSATLVSPSRMIGLSVSSGGSNWRCTTKDSGGSTATDSSIAQSATWSYFKMTITDNSSVRFDLDIGGTLFSTTTTTHIPTDMLAPIFIVGTQANAAKSLTVDRYRNRIENLDRT